MSISDLIEGAVRGALNAGKKPKKQEAKPAPAAPASGPFQFGGILDAIGGIGDLGIMGPPSADTGPSFNVAGEMAGGNGSVVDFSSSWMIPEGLRSDFGEDVNSPVYDSGQDETKVRDAWQQLDAASQERIRALEAQKSLAAPQMMAPQYSPLQALLILAGAGLGGAATRDAGFAAGLVGGFQDGQAGRIGVANQNAQLEHRQRLAQMGIDQEIAGEKMRMAELNLRRATADQQEHERIHARSLQDLLDQAQTLEGKIDKVDLASADMYFARLSKLYKAAGKDWLAPTPQEVSGFKESLKLRDDAKKDDASRIKREGYFQSFVRAGLGHTDVGRGKRFLEMAKAMLSPDDPRHVEVDAAISSLAPTWQQTKALTAEERIALNEELKTVRNRIQSVDKDIRGLKEPDPKKLEEWTELTRKEMELVNKLKGLAPSQSQWKGMPENGVSPRVLAAAAQKAKAGLDCSAFTQCVMDQLSVKLPRTAIQQWKATQGAAVLPPGSIDLAALAPGDLLFFDTGVNHTKDRFVGEGYVTHVGIYLGNGSFIADPGSKSDRRTPQDLMSYQAKFMGATRPMAGVADRSDWPDLSGPTASTKTTNPEAYRAPKADPGAADREKQWNKARDQVVDLEAKKAGSSDPEAIGSLDKKIEFYRKRMDSLKPGSSGLKTSSGAAAGKGSNMDGWNKSRELVQQKISEQKALVKAAIESAWKTLQGKARNDAIKELKAAYKAETGLDYAG